MCPFAQLGGDVTYPHIQVASLPCSGKPERQAGRPVCREQSSGCQRVLVPPPPSSGCSEGPVGGPGGVLSNCSSREKETAGSGPTAPCRLVAWPCCQPSQLNRIQLWPRSLTLTNTVLGQLVAPTVGTPAPRLQPKAGLEGPWVNAIPAVTAEQAGGQWGGRCWSRRWGTQDSEGGRSGGRAFRDFSSAGLEVGQAGGGGAEAKGNRRRGEG